MTLTNVDMTTTDAHSGAIDAEDTAKSITLTLDASNAWTVTADSHLTYLTDPDGISGTTITNIIGNGHRLFPSHPLVQRLQALIHLLINPIIQLIIAFMGLRIRLEGIADARHLADGGREIGMDA